MRTDKMNTFGSVYLETVPYPDFNICIKKSSDRKMSMYIVLMKNHLIIVAMRG